MGGNFYYGNYYVVSQSHFHPPFAAAFYMVHCRKTGHI